MKSKWKEVLQLSVFRWAFVFCVFSILVMIFYLPVFYGQIIEPKDGIYLNDVVLNLFTPHNWSVIIFTLIYISILQTAFSVAKDPRLILLGLTLYFAVSLIRMLSMYIFTLEPPLDMILLIDPVSSKFYPDSTFAKDMFFSGHISTMMVLVLIEPKRWARIIKIVFTFSIALLLAWQHVHYTVDLFVAPIVTCLVYYLLRKLFESPLTT